MEPVCNPAVEIMHPASGALFCLPAMYRMYLSSHTQMIFLISAHHSLRYSVLISVDQVVHLSVSGLTSSGLVLIDIC